MAYEFAGATDVGRKRDHNEDALLVLPDHNVAVVCDGMGGHEAGEVASGIGNNFKLGGSIKKLHWAKRLLELLLIAKNKAFIIMVVIDLV